MYYIAIDGDDIGQKISSCYLSNDEKMLRQVNDIVQEKVCYIADLLKSAGFDILFCAADGVVGRLESFDIRGNELYSKISISAAPTLTFSAGTGRTLREAYIALLYAKSIGKARLCDFEDIR